MLTNTSGSGWAQLGWTNESGNCADCGIHYFGQHHRPCDTCGFPTTYWGVPAYLSSHLYTVSRYLPQSGGDGKIHFLLDGSCHNVVPDCWDRPSYSSMSKTEEIV